MQGNIWAGTYSGVKRFRDGKFFNVPNSDGIPFDLVNALLDMPITAGGAFGPPPLAAGRD